MTSRLLEFADELYALRPADFTPTRDARAKQLRADGERDLAAEVKALRKPSTAAWVVNLLVRRDPDGVARLADVGAALRGAQAAMSAAELRDLTRQRRQLTAAVTSQARALAREEGVRTTEAVAEQVEGVLTAAMVSAACSEAVRSGLLVSAFTTTGLDDVDPRAHVAVAEALGHLAVPRGTEPPPRPDLRVVPDPDAGEKARAAAREALEEAEAAVARAREAHGEAERAVEDLRARQLQLESEIDELRRRIADLESAYDDVDDELGDAQAELEEAAAALQEGEAARDRARAEVERLEAGAGPAG